MATVASAKNPSPTAPPAAPVAATTSLPLRMAPTTKRRPDANEETTPATTKAHPATVASTPSCLKRRKTNTVLIWGPTNGNVADRALPAYAVAITGRRRTLRAPALSSRHCMRAKLANDNDSSATASTNQAHSRCAATRNDDAMRSRSLTRSTTTAPAATAVNPSRPRRLHGEATFCEARSATSGALPPGTPPDGAVTARPLPGRQLLA